MECRSGGIVGGGDVTTNLDTTKLNALLKQLDDKAQKATGEIALLVEAEWKKRVNVDTGAFRNSIAAESIDDETWRISDAVTYGIHQELGTHKMAARPALVPAVMVAERELKERYSEIFE